jgi:hypothetical protein
MRGLPVKRFLGWVLSIAVIVFAYNNCGPISFRTNYGQPNTAGIISAPIGANNVMPIVVGCGYVNQPCVSLKICVPGTSQCQVIENLLLDTGSSGLRIFSSAVSLTLPTQTNSGKQTAECVSYADTTSQWGPIKTADIYLGDDLAQNTPIQVIDSGFASVPSDCTNLDTSFAGYNGILGVGLFKEDCGPGCAAIANNRIYFECSGSDASASCTSAKASLAKQVTNPVALVAGDNNGVLLKIPSIPASGAISVNGSLILGIGTRENNTPVGVQSFTTDLNGNFKTTFNGQTISAFIDSGSNGLFFPGGSNLPDCTQYTGFFCPTTTLNLSAVQLDSNSIQQQTISFSIANAASLLSQSNPNMVFNNLGGKFTSNFDWGLPFFLGRTVFVGLENTTSPLGVGPLWAY